MTIEEARSMTERLLWQSRNRDMTLGEFADLLEYIAIRARTPDNTTTFATSINGTNGLPSNWFHA
jgi:hypothetical protein